MDKKKKMEQNRTKKNTKKENQPKNRKYVFSLFFFVVSENPSLHFPNDW